MTSNYDFKNLGPLLEKAGVSMAEAATIFKVSRPTMYSWCQGHGPTQQLLLNSALKVIAAFQKAVKAGDLPLVNTEKEGRLREICLVLRRYVNGG